MQSCTNELFALCARSNNTIKIHKHLEESYIAAVLLLENIIAWTWRKIALNSTNYYPILVYLGIFLVQRPSQWQQSKERKDRSTFASNNFFDSLTIRGFFYQPSQIFQLKFVSASDPHYVKEGGVLFLNEKRHQKTKQGNECSPDRKSPHKCT